MTIRSALDTDAQRFLDEAVAFFIGVGVAYRSPTLDRIRKHLQQPHIIAYLDDNGVCEVQVDLQDQEIVVARLFPRGQDRRLLHPILHACLTEANRRFPQAKDWRVWAIFYAGVGENGAPDAGLSECRAWNEMYPQAQVIGDSDGARIESTLGAFLEL